MTGQEKTLLLADVGGTNTRVALARNGVLHAEHHFQNAEFDSLDDLLRGYLGAHQGRSINACCVAMAGPVQNGEGMLTNRNWHISTDALRAVLGCDRAVLLNDLSALGHALPHLGEARRLLIDQPKVDANNGQFLVIGMGTGFNICPVQRAGDGPMHCFEVELGHAALPAPLRDALARDINQDASDFPTLEHVFSGDGLARYHHARTGAQLTAKQIVEAHSAGDHAASRTLAGYTALLVELCAQLSFQYMPMGGIYFAGSVARGILRPEFRGVFSKSGDGSGKVGHFLERVPKWIILDDAAALRGCLAALS